MNPVGLQIGDSEIVWFEKSPGSVPAKVAALLRQDSGAVGYLLVGDEVGRNDDVIEGLRRTGYHCPDEPMTRAVRQAVLGRVRQVFPADEGSQLVLALPFWFRDDAALIEAATGTGWESVRTVTDIYALACYHQELAKGHGVLLTMVPGMELVDVGAWRWTGEALLPLAWERWAAGEVPAALARLLRKAGGQGTAAVVAGDLAEAWLREGLAQQLEDAGCRWESAGAFGVARAAALAEVLPIGAVDRLQVALQTQAGNLPMPGPGQAPAWRALTANGAPCLLRLVGGWGDEAAPAITLTEVAVHFPADPVLLRLSWVADTGLVTVCDHSQQELTQSRFELRRT